MKMRKTVFFNLTLLSGIAFAAENLPSALVSQRDELSAQIPVNTLIVNTTPVPQKAPQELQKKLVDSIRSNLAKRMGRDESEYDVAIESLTAMPGLSSKITGPILLLGLGSQGSQRLEGLFNLNLSIPTERGNQEIQVSGLLKVTGPVVVAKNNLPHGHKIAEEDLQVMRLPWRGLSNGIPGTAMADLVGQRTRTHIGVGTAIHPDLLDEPLAFQSGDLVELLIQSGPGVMIRSRGIAKQEGRVGDTIRIEQPDTKKKLSAIIRGPKSVEVNL